MPPIEFLVERREGGKTIAFVLRSRFQLSWSHVKRIVERGHVRVAGFACNDPGHRVRYRNRVWIRDGIVETREARPVPAAPSKTQPPPTNPKPVRPKSIPVPVPVDSPIDPEAILYLDDEIVVVNKPAGLTTMRHAEEAEEFGPRGQRFLPKTLADLLPRFLGPKSRVIPVHRLDRDTSGVLVLARTPEAAASLTRQFRQHSTDRRYLALVRGHPTSGRIESQLIRDRGDGRRGSTPTATPESKQAVTLVQTREVIGDFALVECRLETGRTHQVRIHLGEQGTPLCGERVYDRPVNGSPIRDRSGAKRPMLHAYRLGLRHPSTNEPMDWETPPPEDFLKLLERLQQASTMGHDLNQNQDRD